MLIEWKIYYFEGNITLDQFLNEKILIKDIDGKNKRWQY